MTTVEPSLLTTCIPLGNYSALAPTSVTNVTTSADTLAGFDSAAGYAAYSTALSVTIAIGCSLLILNVLIFAGVYYQRVSKYCVLFFVFGVVFCVFIMIFIVSISQFGIFFFNI